MLYQQGEEGRAAVPGGICALRKNSDQDNLAGTVNRLLALREAANLVYLAKDAQKQGEMEAMAG